MRKPLLALLAAASALAPLAAQTCGAGQRLLKNDILPDNPTGSYTIGIVPGLCDGEAAMSLFNAGGPVKVTSVAIGYGHRFGTNGVQAIADVEIYDGATVNAAGRWTLGPLLFRLSSGSTNVQLQSTGINLVTLPAPVRVPSGRPVIGFRMLQNLAAGSCALGYDANFFCDADNQCRAGINILDATGHGPVDPATYTGFGPPLCPLFFRGSWVIRCCVEPEISVDWQGNPTPGGVLSLTYIAPGRAGENYIGLCGGSFAGGGFNTPFGHVPLDPDPFFLCFMTDCRSMLVGAQGVIGANDRAFGGMLIPNLPVLVNSGLTLYLAFVLHGASLTFTGESLPSTPIVIN
ncbi:MAG: hypothetical protein R3F56_18240 [Planctomycetota bacterium]